MALLIISLVLILAIVMRRRSRRRFLQRVRLMSPEIRKMGQNEGIGRVLAEELENLTAP